MKYKNKKTGVVIDVQSELRGAWEPVEEPKKAEPAPAKPKNKTKKKG